MLQTIQIVVSEPERNPFPSWKMGHQLGPQEHPPVPAMLGGEGAMQFLYDAARGQLRVHGSQVR